MVAAGVAGDGFVIARFNSDGSPDTAFGTDGSGIVRLLFDSTSGATAVALQADGKIVAGGDVCSGNCAFTLVRLESHGVLDTSFAGGRVTIPIGNGSLTDIAIQPDGKIDTVLNQGNVSAAASSTRYYLSLDGSKDAGDILLTGKRSVVSLSSMALSNGHQGGHSADNNGTWYVFRAGLRR